MQVYPGSLQYGRCQGENNYPIQEKLLQGLLNHIVKQDSFRRHRCGKQEVNITH